MSFFKSSFVKFIGLFFFLFVAFLTEINGQENSVSSLKKVKLKNEEFLFRFYKKLKLETGNIEKINKTLLIRLSGLSTFDRKYMSKKVDPRHFFSQVTLDNMKMPRMNRELKCLSEALYFEARGEQLEGQIAVADVIINRKNSKNFPNTICRVVSEGSHKRNACQFSYNCDGKLELIYDKLSYSRITKLSSIILNGAFADITGGATFFHATEVSPSWAKKFKETKKIGRHIFYSR